MKIVDLLGGQAEYYLNHTCKTIDKQLIHIPGPDMIDKVWMNSDRNIRTLEVCRLYTDMDVWPIRAMYPFCL